MIGTGGRDTGACANALAADPAVELVAMADIGLDRVEESCRRFDRNFRIRKPKSGSR
jgi:predicted dehydrogenase